MDSLEALQSQNSTAALAALAQAGTPQTDEFAYVTTMGSLTLVAHVREWDGCVERVFCNGTNILDAMSDDALDRLGAEAQEWQVAVSPLKVDV